MLRFSIITLLLLLFTSACTTIPKTVKTLKGEELELVWCDEFDGNELDESKWELTPRNKSDWGNYMSKDPRCLKVSDGVLRLRGIVNDNQDKDPVPYLTGGVYSKGKYSFKYGKVEIRAKYDSAQGCWPALWMLGNEGGWPSNGEMDLMEHLNLDKFVYQTLHSLYTNKREVPNKQPSSAVVKIDPDLFNTYGAEWDENSITFTINGKATLTYKREPEKGPKQFPFEQPFYIVLSMQIEGSWVGKADPKQYPAEMLIDWVRVYQ